MNSNKLNRLKGQFALFDKQLRLLCQMISACDTATSCSASSQNPINELLLQCGVLTKPQQFPDFRGWSG